MKKISYLSFKSRHLLIEDCVKTIQGYGFGMLLRERNWGKDLMKAAGFYNWEGCNIHELS